ncbi:hypothetical protein [Variovorax boronicumulans]|uniref:hypothetical protein n=1 Tax=Variovorax boronicumulans TaxID=436515 RepID=UPI0012F74DC6|nr:hypothetical protein [Variovorax boronicumulans]
MEVAFSSRELRTQCESNHVAKRSLGESAAMSLMGRLADLRVLDSAASLFEMGLNIHPDPTVAGRLHIPLGETHVLVAEAVLPTRLAANSALEWAKISRLKLLRIEKKNV